MRVSNAGGVAVGEKGIGCGGSSDTDLRAMPDEVRQTFGYALALEQNGLRYDDGKTLAGFKPAVVEVLEDDDGDTFRAVYTAHYADAVYVLHCFKKKSTSGRNLPKRDRETIEARLSDVKRVEAAKAQTEKRY